MKKQGRWQELLRLMRRNGKIAAAGKLAAGAASITILSVGGHYAWKQFQQDSVFRPELFANSQALHGNQITFPENEEYKGNEQTSDPGENERLQRDRRVEEDLGKQKQDKASFEMDAEDPNAVSENIQNLLIAQDEQNSAVVPPSGLTGSAVLLAGGNDTENADTVYTGGSNGISSGNTAGSGNAGNSAAGSGSGAGGDSGSDSAGGAGTGGGSGTAGGGTGDVSQPEQPSNPDNPAPSPEPVPTPDNPVYDPDYPDGSAGPSLPKDPMANFGIIVPNLPKDGVGEDCSVTLSVLEPFDADTEYLYQGAVLTDWKILCSLLVYMDVTDSEGETKTYRINECNEYFKIKKYPQYAEEGMEVTFSFRPNVNSEWIDQSYSFQNIKFAKVIALGEPDAEGNCTELKHTYLDKGEPVYFSPLRKALFDASTKQNSEEPLTKLLRGWSNKENGELLPGRYFKPQTGGRYLLYPLMEDVLPGYKVMLKNIYWDKDSQLTAAQILTDYPGDTQTLTIPEGIQNVKVEKKLSQENILESVYLPASVEEFSFTPNATKAYEVDDQNPYFSSQDGLLYDKDFRDLLKIPENKTSIKIPESVTSIHIQKPNHLTKIEFCSSRVPQIDDWSALENAVFIIPSDGVMNYMQAWGNIIEQYSIKLETEYGPVTEDYGGDDNGNIVSSDKTVLYRATKDCYGLYFLPKSVIKVAADAFSESKNINGIYIPNGTAQVQLDNYCLEKSNVTRMYIDSDTSPKIEKDTFEGLLDAGALEVWVPDHAYETYVEEWSKIFDKESVLQILHKGFAYKEKNGVQYLEENGNGAVLLRVSEKVKSFDEINTLVGDTGLTWIRIGAKAFEKSGISELLEIPESVCEIDAYAFSGCTNLKILLFHAKSDIFIGEKAFPALKFVSFDAQNVVFEDRDTMQKIICFAPIGSHVHDQEWNGMDAEGWGDSYQVVKGTTGYFVYGIMQQKEAGIVVYQNSYLLGATSDVSGAIQSPENYPLEEIRKGALEGCKREMTLSELEAKTIMAIGEKAFKESGISGTLTFSGELFKIDKYAFAECDKLKKIVFQGNGATYKLNIDEHAFHGSAIEEFVFPARSFVLWNDVFADCNNIKRVTFSDINSPELILFSAGMPYDFHFGENTTVMIEPENSQDIETAYKNYRNAWKYYLIGYAPGDHDQLVGKIKGDIFGDITGKGSGESDIEPWPSKELMGDEFPDGFIKYWNAWANYKAELLLHSGDVKACKILGVEEPDESELPDPPKLSDYRNSASTELASPSNAIMADEILNEDGTLDPEDPLEEETNSDSEQDSDDSKQTPDFLPPKDNSDDANSADQNADTSSGSAGTGGNGTNDSETDKDGSESGDTDGRDSDSNDIGSGEDGDAGSDSDNSDSGSGSTDSSGQDTSKDNTSDSGSEDSGNGESDSDSAAGDTDASGNSSDTDNSDSAGNDSAADASASAADNTES